MGLVIQAQGAAVTAARLRGVPSAITDSAVDAVNTASTAARDAAVDYTYQRMNMDREDIAKYVDFHRTTTGQTGGTIVLKVRGIPLEMFHPSVQMQNFSFTDRAGRRVTRSLPAIYYTRFRGGASKYLRPAFPLHQRTSGFLTSGDRILRRIGSRADDRTRLTRFRFYTFPKQFLQDELLPHIKEVVGPSFKVAFRGAFRKRNGGDRALQKG